MRVDDSLLPIHQSTLVYQQESVILEQAIQSVQHGRVAEVHVVKDNPMSTDNRFDQRAVDPFKRHMLRRSFDRLDR